MKPQQDFQIRPAHVDDVSTILQLIRDLATYERAPNDVTATEEQLVDVLFGERPAAEVLLAFEGRAPVGFAVFFYNFSTWLARPGLYLEDLFVKPEKRGKGYGRALVSRDGCVDWLCLPRFDSPACFASLLGDTRNGHWRFFPEEEVVETRRRYRGDSLILETEIETKSGAVRLIDFMPPRGENPDIIRIVEGLRGKVSMQMELIIRFDYGQIVPWVRQRNDGLEAIAGPDGLILRTPIETRGEDLTTVAEFTVGEGEQVPFVLTWFASHKDPPRAIHYDHALHDTERYWRAWSKQFRGQGKWRDAVMRSLIVLKGLTYAPTGGLV